MRIDLRKFDLMLARRCKSVSELRSIISSQTLTRIRHGSNIKPSTLGKIARILDCDPEDITEEG